jgi:Mrp family chromosome partitioning ATPase/capsular polysaccharide biosynthesis protein
MSRETDNQNERMMLLSNMIPVQARTSPVSADPVYDSRWMMRVILSRPLLTMLIPLLFALAALTFVLYRPAQYTATSTLNVSNFRLTLSRDDAFFAELQFDPTFLETQIQIIASESVLNDLLTRITIDDVLGSTSDSEEVGTIASQSAIDPKKLEDFRRELSVQRVGMSNLVNISFTADSPQRAARVANAFTNSYLAKLERDRLDAAEAASSWLRGRLQEVGPKAQVVSEAVPPIRKSNPSGAIIIVVAGMVGAAVGVVAALALALTDNRIRSPEQVHRIFGVPCLGLVPTLGSRRWARKNGSLVLRKVIDQPLSSFWHALRQADISLRTIAAPTGPRMIGVTSTVPGEGKTTIAANFAYMKAKLGERVLLVDAQPYDLSLSTLLAPGASLGLADMLRRGETAVSPYIVGVDESIGLDVLPLGTTTPPDVAAQLLWSDAMTALMPSFADYDVVVFDLPPLIAMGDLTGAAQVLGSFVLVTEWGKLTSEALQTGISMNPLLHQKLAGVVLNRADRSRMKKVISPFATLLKRQSALVNDKRYSPGTL